MNSAKKSRGGKSASLHFQHLQILKSPSWIEQRISRPTISRPTISIFDFDSVILSGSKLGPGFPCIFCCWKWEADLLSRTVCQSQSLTRRDCYSPPTDRRGWESLKTVYRESFSTSFPSHRQPISPIETLEADYQCGVIGTVFRLTLFNRPSLSEAAIV